LGSRECRPRLTSRAWYFNGITIDPQNSDVIYVPNVALYRSEDGGKTISIVRGAPGVTITTSFGSIPEILPAWFWARIRHYDQPRPRPNLEYVVQPAHGAALSRNHRQPVPYVVYGRNKILERRCSKPHRHGPNHARDWFRGRKRERIPWRPILRIRTLSI